MIEFVFGRVSDFQRYKHSGRSLPLVKAHNYFLLILFRQLLCQKHPSCVSGISVQCAGGAGGLIRNEHVSKASKVEESP